MSYAKKAIAATKAIRKGSESQSVVVTHIGVSTYDVNTSTASQPAPIVQNGYALNQIYEIHEIDGTLIQRGDKKIMLAVGGITAIDTGDTCVTGGVTYLVKNVQPFAPGGVVIFYYVQLRA